ncbi:hypothetical protein SDJN03_00771, partial [Cucurbita argyrosperma subsp. sororia]
MVRIAIVHKNVSHRKRDPEDYLALTSKNSGRRRDPEDYLISFTLTSKNGRKNGNRLLSVPEDYLAARMTRIAVEEGS